MCGGRGGVSSAEPYLRSGEGQFWCHIDWFYFNSPSFRHKSFEWYENPATYFKRYIFRAYMYRFYDKNRLHVVFKGVDYQSTYESVALSCLIWNAHGAIENIINLPVINFHCLCPTEISTYAMRFCVKQSHWESTQSTCWRQTTRLLHMIKKSW